jgi:hypothetical protein
MKNAGLDALALPAYLQDLGSRLIWVLDDDARRMRPLDEVRELVRRIRIPDNWYVNLWARRV